MSPADASAANSPGTATPGAPLRLLIVEDVAADAELEMYELRRAGVAAVCRVVETAEEMATAISAFEPDVILSDFTLPHFDGLSALSLAQLKILQEAITLSVFVPFAILYMNQPLKLDYLWASLCIMGAVYFVFRG